MQIYYGWHFLAFFEITVALFGTFWPYAWHFLSPTSWQPCSQASKMPSRHRQKEEGEAAEESSEDSVEDMPKAKSKAASAPVAKEEIVRMRAAERRVLIMEGEQRGRGKVNGTMAQDIMTKF